MSFVHLSAGCVNQIPLDWEGNTIRLKQAIDSARNLGAEVLCLPELCLSGYGCEDQFLASSTTAEAWNRLMDLVPWTKSLIVSVGLPLDVHGRIYNAAALLVDGHILGFYLKQNLARDGIHYEPRWFRAWPSGSTTAIQKDGKSYPVGDFLFDVGGLIIGYEICEDAWVANRPGRRYSAESVDLILNPSASHFAFGKNKIRENFVTDASRSFSVAYIYANLVGNEAGRIIYDGQCLIASNGAIIQRGPRFSFNDSEIISVSIDIDLNRLARRRSGAQGDIKSAHPILVAPFQWKDCPKALPDILNENWNKEIEWARAIGLGLFDYMRKTRSRGFVLSLSGGADSTATAVMVWIMRELAIAQLGSVGFAKKLAYWNVPEGPSMSDILFCVYQQTSNSGPVTEEAARTIARSIQAEYALWNVEPLVKAYHELVQNTLNRQLNWSTDDLALQNIQARVRSPGPWMMANCRGALFLTTSNRSEASVGYTTMDGDTSGGLAPLGGTDKAFVLQWLKWMESQNGFEIPSLPSLAIVNQLEPTAELRPGSHSQKDEKDLMPYTVLDQIERWAIRDKKNPIEIYHLAKAHYLSHSPEEIGTWITRFFQLWSRNQWKRERLAPNFHVDDENVDPKTWCRFPILNSGFDWELSQLKCLIRKDME
ncbi:MAG: NAD(+) synthase [Verrucomicrobia bacterium]|nr:NAD(+) synthase [Verrucomicrobiota bacterium]